ncbi:MAG: hypothetical protein M1321_00485 [Candidatus Marsarchaeota archaeon]|nr:hypothetical protein [Candidatus Marsarchaeota archaeon]MCL5427648.1 hypothetical protein [Candidatus Marsarchaeota archaeon]
MVKWHRKHRPVPPQPSNQVHPAILAQRGTAAHAHADPSRTQVTDRLAQMRQDENPAAHGITGSMLANPRFVAAFISAAKLANKVASFKEISPDSTVPVKVKFRRQEYETTMRSVMDIARAQIPNIISRSDAKLYIARNSWVKSWSLERFLPPAWLWDVPLDGFVKPTIGIVNGLYRMIKHTPQQAADDARVRARVMMSMSAQHNSAMALDISMDIAKRHGLQDIEQEAALKKFGILLKEGRNSAAWGILVSHRLTLEKPGHIIFGSRAYDAVMSTYTDMILRRKYDMADRLARDYGIPGAKTHEMQLMAFSELLSLEGVPEERLKPEYKHVGAVAYKNAYALAKRCRLSGNESLSRVVPDRNVLYDSRAEKLSHTIARIFEDLDSKNLYYPMERIIRTYGKLMEKYEGNAIAYYLDKVKRVKGRPPLP